MKQKKYNYQKATVELTSLTCMELKKKTTLHNFGKKLRIMVNSYIGLTPSERKKLYEAYYVLMRNMKAQGTEARWSRLLGKSTVYDPIITVARKVQASSDIRHKKISVKLSVANHTIFFLCSKHSDCAEDHLPYQGKVYVDKYWRQHTNGDLYYRVASYIKNHKVLTVQDVMNGPPYLTTRPYCRHFFIPVSTATVLGTSLNKLNNNHRIKDKPALDKKQERLLIYQAVNRICGEDTIRPLLR